MDNKKQRRVPVQRGLKRGDLVVEQIKRWITEKNLRPGAKLPKEAELQEHFSVSRGTMREALKALEVQGLISLSTGPGGGATIESVSLDRTFQFLQNYLFFQDISVHDIYAVRRLLEPALAAAAVPHLTPAHYAGMARSIQICEPIAGVSASMQQRTEDLHFHDIFADACPNAFLRFQCKLINALLQTLVIGSVHASPEAYQQLGSAAVRHHKKILAAARERDAPRVAKLMLAHIVDTERHLERVQAALRSKLLLDSEMKLGPSMFMPGSR